jgi:uncharacterized protein YndB with AHSA1/START domain
MITYRIEQTINRPVHDVFSYVADPMRYPDWMDVSDVQVSTPGKVRVGSEGRATMKVRSRMVPYTWEVTGYQADESFAFRTTGGPFDWEGRYDVSPAGDAVTRIITTGTVGLRGWQRLLEPFMRAELRQGEAAELRGLKELLERPA